MKKIKFMLLSLALVAVVGGALAFKAKTGQHFCTTFAIDYPTDGNVTFTCIDPNLGQPRALKCTSYLTEFTTGGTGDWVCTTTDDGQGGCSGNLNCLAPIEQTQPE